jgi:hypothetical protein
MTKEKIEGQKMSAERLARASAMIDEASLTEHQREAAGFAETILEILRAEWADRGFTREQAVFAVALATVNLRETFPEENGGKAAFDEIAAQATAYYRSNT